MPDYKNIFSFRNEGSTAVIDMFGYVGPDDKINLADFKKKYDEALQNATAIKINVNSGGGSIDEGLAIYDLLMQSSLPSECEIIGMAASMGSIFPLACDKIRINANARVGTHKAQNFAMGEVGDIRAVADSLEKQEEKLKGIYMERTGNDRATIESWMVPGKFTWHDADAAVKNGLADEKIPAKKGARIASNKLAGKNDQQAWNAYYNDIELPDHKQNNDDMSKELKGLIIAALGESASTMSLKDEESDAVFVSKVKQISDLQKQKIVDLNNQVAAVNKSKAEALINGAILDKKILPTDKAKWVERAEKDYDMAFDSIAAIPAIKNLNTTLDRGTGGKTPAAGEDRKDWTFTEWTKKDVKGLEEMQKNNPDAFAALMKAEFNN